jgi:hypothetical protein
MKSKLRFMTISSLFLALIVPTAVPRAHAAAQVNVFRFNGSSVIASFHSLDLSGCIITDTFVFASAGTIYSPPGGTDPSQVTGVSVSQFDQCAGGLTRAAVGSTSDVNFQIAKNLSSATLSGSFLLDDVVAGTTLQVTVNLTWTGNGNTVHQVSHGHLHLPGFVENDLFNGDMQDGQASGMISGAGENFAAGASVSAQLQQDTVGSITVQVPR